MKKLNRKGFTLVELLAVIIILAIVVGISIPAINSIINGSKNSALGTEIKAAAKYLGEQYDIYNLDTTTAGAGFVSYMTNYPGQNQSITSSDALFTEMGFDANKVTEVDVCITSTGQVYVEVQKIPTTSEYYTTQHWNTDGTAKENTDVKNIVGTRCPETE